MLAVLVRYSLILVQVWKADAILEAHDIGRHDLPFIAVDNLRNLFERRTACFDEHEVYEDELEEEPDLEASADLARKNGNKSCVQRRLYTTSRQASDAESQLD